MNSHGTHLAFAKPEGTKRTEIIQLPYRKDALAGSCKNQLMLFRISDIKNSLLMDLKSTFFPGSFQVNDMKQSPGNAGKHFFARRNQPDGINRRLRLNHRNR